MGAAVGIASAAVGAVGTISGISAQAQQQRAQDDALAAQQEASSMNIALRTQEIERQKLFAQFQVQLDQLNRQSERMFNDLENFAVNQQFQQQEAQVQQQQQEQSLLSQRGAQLQQFQAGQQLSQQQQQLASRQTLENIQGGVQGAQLDIQAQNALFQRQLASGALGRQALGEEQRFRTTQFQTQQGLIQQLASAGRSTQQELLGIGQSQIGQQGQIAGALDQIQQEILASVSSQRDQAKARALARVQLTGGATAGMSASDLALLGESLSQEETNFATTSSRSQRLIDQLAQDADFANNLSAQLSQATRLRGVASALGIQSQASLANQQNIVQNLLTSNQIAESQGQQNVELASRLAQLGVSRSQLQATQGLSAMDIIAQGNAASQQAQLTSGLANIENIQRQLGISQQAALQLAEINLSRGAQGLLQTEQANRQDIQDAAARINAAFGEQALQSQLLGTQAAGASEQAALAAARRTTGGGGLGTFLGAGASLLSAGSQIAGILGQRNVQPQVTNPLFQQSSQGFLNRSVFAQPSSVPQQPSIGGFTGQTVNANLGF